MKTNLHQNVTTDVYSLRPFHVDLGYQGPKARSKQVNAFHNIRKCSLTMTRLSAFL